MEDERARHLADRVIYNEWPRELSTSHYVRTDRGAARALPPA
jgi:hypothetical protein